MKKLIAIITLIACCTGLISCRDDGRHKKDDGVFEIRDGYLFFGEYPQTIKSSDVTISETVDERGYYLGSDGAYYAKTMVTPFGKSAIFSNGEVGFEGDIFYFKVEPLRWRVVDEYQNTITVLSDCILYGSVFNSQGVCDYEKSDVRKSLNEDFYNIAFSIDEKNSILLSGVDNSAVTTIDRPNYNCCPDTEDYLYLLSYSDVMGTNYGFNEENRKMKTTDYAKATGSSNYWWLRSPNSSWDDEACYVTTSGNIRTDGWTMDGIDRSVTGTQGVVPAMKINK